MNLRPFAAFLALALPCPARAHAGLDTGTVEVRLAPAAATAAAPSVARLHALAFDWSAEVEERDGATVFLHVPPGRYELTVERADAAPARSTARVFPGRATILRATLAPGSSSIETLVLDQPAEGTAFGDDWLRDLPGSRDPWSLLETVEAVSVADRMDTGGVWAGLPGRVTAHGTSLTQATFLFAGADVIDPLGSGFSLLDPDLAWLSSLRLATSLLPAGVSGAGPVLTATPRRPGASWSASLTADAARPHTARAGVAPPVARLDHWRNGTIVASGPLGERAGLLFAAGAREAGRFEREEPLVLPSRVLSAMGQLTFRPGAGHEARLLAAGQSVERPYAARAAALDPARQEDAGFALAQGEWRGRRRDGATAGVKLAYARGTHDSAGTSLGSPVERLRDGPVPEIPLPGKRVLTRVSAEAEVERPGALIGTRGVVQMGASVTREEAEMALVPGTWVVPERLGGVGARVWEQSVGRDPSRWRSTDAAAWIEGRTDAARRWSVRAGARLEWLDASAASGGESVSWLTVSPRLRARWRLGEKLALLAGAGQYRHGLPLSHLAFGDRAAPTATVHRWDDRDADGVFRTQERGPLVARAGPGATVASLDGGLRAPLTREVLIGIERRGGLWTARLVGLYRRETDLLETVNTGLTAADYIRRTVPDPGGDILGPGDDQLLPVYERRASSFGRDRYLLTNVPGDDAWHEGAEITLAREGERLGLLFGATAHRSDGPNAWTGFRASENDQGFVGERRDHPNADTFARGRLFGDRAYTIKVAGRYAAPRDLRLGLVARYQDGQPFARLVIARDLAQGAEAVQAVPNGRHRFEFAISVDARIEKGLDLGRARLALVAEGFNLLGNAHEAEEDVLTGAAFRAVTASQPPRVFRFGLRLDLR
ncbi:MAG TPA: hypothetical protein VMT87_07280 [Vicinamibacteria bacterium]|nr:hypothetical protein [Vicinamibacteria bacterium]